MRGTWVSLRGHEIRSARLAGSAPVDVAAGEEVTVVGLSEAQYFGDWRGGRGPDGRVTIGISHEAVGEAVKEVRARCASCSAFPLCFPPCLPVCLISPHTHTHTTPTPPLTTTNYHH